MTCTDIILTISIDIYLDGDFPDESSTLSKLSKKSKPRSRSVDRDRSTKAGAGGRSVSVSEDSGNSSLNTYATDTIQTSNSDWVNAPQRLIPWIEMKIPYFIILFPGTDPIEDTTTWDGINDDDSDDKMIR